MPYIIKNISGEVLDIFEGTITGFGISGEFGQEDYIILPNFVAYLQDFSSVDTVTDLETPAEFGLTFNKNKEFTELNCSY